MFVVSLLVLTCKATDSAQATADVPEWDEDSWLTQLDQMLFPAEQYIDVVLVGDRSGSMDQYRGSSQTGTREFVDSHRNTARASSEDHTLNGVKTHLTVVTFDNQVEVPYSGDALAMCDADIDRCVRAMEPRASTMLYDTAIDQINAQAARMMAAEQEGKVVHAVFALLTDGQDNGSRRYSSSDLREHIAAHEARGVDCMFVQAGRNAMAQGREYGFAADRTLEMGYEADHAQSAMRAVSEQSTTYTRSATVTASPSCDCSATPVAPVVRSATSAPSSAFTPLERHRSA